MNKQRYLADLVLFLASMLWGSGYFFQKVAAETTAALTFNVIRYAVAALTLLCLAKFRFPQKGDLSSALYRVKRQDFVVLLEHDPSAWRRKILPHSHVQLTLSGHTHGGQFNLFGITPFTIGFERIKLNHRPTLAVSGLHDIDGMRLLVSKGVGASRLQLRVGVQPEINQIIFE